MVEGLDCDQRALEGMRRVLFTRLDEMCELRAAALDWSDIEGVHDMRVASRRLRSLLKDFRPYFHGQIRQKRLRELARSLGMVRDQDVAIEALHKLAAEAAPEDVAQGLGRIIHERERRRERARKNLAESISEDDLADLRDKLALRFREATRSTEAVPIERAAITVEAIRRPTELTFQQAGRAIILKRLAELQDLGESLYHPFDVEPLHDMRIAAKRLRYAIELFAQCWGEHLNWFSKEVARLQDSLGELHDCDVWIEDFGVRLAHMPPDAKMRDEERGAYSAERCAAVWLLQYFSKQRAKHYRHALSRWHEWERAGFDARLAAILNGEISAEPQHDDAVAASDAQSRHEAS